MTTITTSGTVINLHQNFNIIEYQTDNTGTLGAWTVINAWPATFISTALNTGNPFTSLSSTNPLVVTLKTNLTISTSTTGTTNSGKDVYFIIGNQYTTFAGSNKTITIDTVTDYPGLIQNGITATIPGFANVTIENLGVLVNTTGTASKLANYGGWICQTYFGNKVSSNSVNNCYSTGAISGNNSGGIFGYNIGSSGTGNATNCYSTGAISGSNSGGIFGPGTGFSGTWNATNCYSTGAISGSNSGGIFGSAAGGSGTASAINCYSTGAISGSNLGGIFGSNAGYTNGNVSAINCYSMGIISGGSSGGIFGATAGYNNGTVYATNCYSTGTISGTSSGGIFGINTGISNGTVNATNCYFNGPTSKLYGSLGNSIKTKNINNIYGYNNSWVDTQSTPLRGVPATKPGIGNIWTSITANTPFVLTLTYAYVGYVPLPLTSDLLEPFYVIYDTPIPTYYYVSSKSIIIEQPQSKTIYLNQIAFLKLSVVAVEYGPFKYQWFKSTIPYTSIDIPIPNSDSPILIITNLTKKDSGNYYVVITNSYGAKTISDIATVTII